MAIINTTNVRIDLASAGCSSCISGIIGVDDEYTTDINTPININVIGNDILNGQQVMITNMTQPEYGELVLENDGTITYTPSNAYTGTVTSTISIIAENGTTSTEVLTIHVGSDKNDIVYTAINEAVDSDVMYNDTGIENIDDYSISSVVIRDYNGGDIGTATIIENGGSDGRDAIHFTPPNGYMGPVLIDVTFVNGQDSYTTVLVVQVGCENCQNASSGFTQTRRDGDNLGNMTGSYYVTSVLAKACGINLDRDLSNYSIDVAFSPEDSINVDDNSVTILYRDDINRYDVSGKVGNINYVLEDGALLSKLVFKATITHCNGSIFTVLLYIDMLQNIELEINDDWEVLVTNEDATFYSNLTNNNVSNIDLTVKSITHEYCSSTIEVGDSIRLLTYTVTPEPDFVGNATMTIVWQDANGTEYPEVYHYEVGCGGIHHDIANDVDYREDSYRSYTYIASVDDVTYVYERDINLFDTSTLMATGNVTGTTTKYDQFTYEIEREYADDDAYLGYFDNLSLEEYEVVEAPNGEPILRLRLSVASLSGGCPTRADGNGGSLSILRYKIKMTPCNGSPVVNIHVPLSINGAEIYTPTTETYDMRVGETLEIPNVLANDTYGYSEFTVFGVVQAYNGQFTRVNNTTVRYVSDSSFIGIEEVSIIMIANPCYTQITKKIKINVMEN